MNNLTADLINETQNLNLNNTLMTAELNSNLETIVDLIDKINKVETELAFFNLILGTALNLIPEADYGRIVVGDQNSAYFLEKVYRQEELNFELEKSGVGFSNFNSFDIILKSKQLNKKLVINLELDNEFLGAIILYKSVKNNSIFSDHAYKMASFLERIAISHLKTDRYQKLQLKFKEELIMSLSNLLAIHDQYTKGHNQKVAELSKNLAQAAGLNKSQINKAYWSGLLHDIAKILIPASILNKKGSLTKAEFNKLKKHPRWAYQILKDSSELKEIAKYVLHHHERWDGNGYPDRLSGDEIPLISQIITIADAWDAMTSDRSYRKALSSKEAVIRLKNNRGSQFSPELIDIFLDNIS